MEERRDGSIGIISEILCYIYRYMVTCLTCLRIGETSMEEIVGYGFEEDSSGGKRVVEFLLSCSV